MRAPRWRWPWGKGGVLALHLGVLFMSSSLLRFGELGETKPLILGALASLLKPLPQPGGVIGLYRQRQVTVNETRCTIQVLLALHLE
jgi:hypothetical protein